MSRRELVMLAKVFESGKHTLSGMMASEKLDGQRALWLPETVGLRSTEVPFANRQRDQREYTCTGLWSRYGKVIHCPSWFIGNLPWVPLDGELWMGRGRFQETMSVVKQLIPDSRWDQVMFMVFDSPAYGQVYRQGEIKGVNYQCIFSEAMRLFWEGATTIRPPHSSTLRNFEETYYWLKATFPALMVHQQVRLPSNSASAESTAEAMLASIVSNGGEGLMIRNPSSFWEPVRVGTLLKMKPWHDDEAIVVGHQEGKGKYAGMLGALVVTWKGIMFNLSGMTDEERRNPAKIGTVVTFRYRELSNDGVPKEARYLREYQS